MEDYLTQITNYLLTQSWQIAILVAAVAAVSWLLRNKSAHVCYLLWLIVLAKCLVPPLVTVPLAVLPQERPVLLLETPPPVISEPVASPPVPDARPAAPSVAQVRTRLNVRPLLGIGWITGVSVFVLVAMTKALQTISWLRRERKPLPAELQTTIEELFSELGTLPKLWLIDGIGQPFVWGLLRGSIYLPANFVRVDSAEHRRGILGHELSHILRFDAAVNLLQVIAQAIFWFHPFVWCANKRIRAEREKCCDEMAIARLGAKARDYSKAIVNILIREQESTRPVPSLAVAGPVKNIEERIKTMLRPGKKFYKRPSLVAAAVVMLIALFTVPTALILTTRADKAGGAAHEASESEVPEYGGRVTCTGIVVDSKDKPVAGALVRLYEIVWGPADDSHNTKAVKAVTTKGDGHFHFTASLAAVGFRIGTIAAQKEGLAIGWDSWRDIGEDQEMVIKLDEPKELTGIVVDENGEPIGGAKVSIRRLWTGQSVGDRVLSRPVAPELLTVMTDSRGKFTFGNLPPGVTADLIVKKEGRATVTTVDPESANLPLRFTPGQEDIKIEMPREARIEGIVVQKDSGKSVAGVMLLASAPEQEPVTSKEDGTFSINALYSGKYLLRLATTRENLADWVPEPVENIIEGEDGTFSIGLYNGEYPVLVSPTGEKLADWVAEPVEVTVQAGKTKDNVKIEVSKGALLDIVVTDEATKKNLENARVVVWLELTQQSFYVRSDKHGIAQIRLPPGRYQILSVGREGYRIKWDQQPAMIEEGKTERIEIPLAVQPKVVGVVRDEAGKPVSGTKIRVVGAEDRVSNTDADGRFQISWDPSYRNRRREKSGYLVARHEQRNLVSAIRIDEDTKTLDITLEPGIVFTGKVTDPQGNGIDGAQVCVAARLSAGYPAFCRVRAGAEGSFEVKGIPPGEPYSIIAGAEGYGQKDVTIQPDRLVNKRLEVESLILPVPNLSVSGLVVDVQDKVVAGVGISARGEGRIYRRTRTDTNGRFTIQNVCEGRIEITAISRKTRSRGRIETEAGAIGVKIVVSPVSATP